MSITTKQSPRKSTQAIELAPKPRPRLAASAPIVPKLGITVDRLRALAAHGSNLDWELYGPPTFVADGAEVLHEEFDLLVVLFTAGESAGDVVAVTSETTNTAAASGGRTLVVREIGSVRDGAFHDFVAFAEKFDLCPPLIRGLSREVA